MISPFSAPTHEPALSRSARRGRGAFYTPLEVAEWIVRGTYEPLLATWDGNEPPPKMIDPACGGGVFLVAAARSLERRCRELGLSEQDHLIAQRRAIWGIEIDPSAVAIAREQLPQLTWRNVRRGDALAEQLPAEQPVGEFDAVVGNPPYVNIRELARTHGAGEVQALRERFRTARGNFDLYVLFIERALELLRPGGRLGFIIPNKWATLDYARTLRELLLCTTLEQVVDLSGLRVFPQASTYPQVIVLCKRGPEASHRVQVLETSASGSSSLEKLVVSRRIPQSSLSPRAFVFGSDLVVESRGHCVPLAEVCTLHSGASGYSAQRLAGSLWEHDELTSDQRAESVEFVVSGNVDRYSLRNGDVRFLQRRWSRPSLPLGADCLTEEKRRLYREPKLLFSGMSRRLEVAYDEQGCGLGVQVYAAREPLVDLFYLLGVLNSKLLSYLFRERFAAKRLAGGYLAINKGQLAQLPIRTGQPGDKAGLHGEREIATLAREQHVAYSVARDQRLDKLVYELYELSPAERRQIEAAFSVESTAMPARRAA